MFDAGLLDPVMPHVTVLPNPLLFFAWDLHSEWLANLTFK